MVSASSPWTRELAAILKKKRVDGKRIFLFYSWDMLVPRRVNVLGGHMTLFHVKCRALDEFDEGVRHRISNVAILFRNNQLQGMVFCDLLGMVK